MKNNRFTKLAVLLTLVLAAAFGASAQQQSLTQTTLSSAVTGPALYSGTTPNIQTQVFLASTTGIVAPVLPGTPASVIYVGREAMGVFSVNTTLNFVVVIRGYMGTQAAPHPSGDMVLVAPAYNTTLGTGANPVPSGLFQQDAPLNGTCTAANTTTAPWVNVVTGAQWLCSSITGTFVPGFINPLCPIYCAPTTAVASASTILPTGPLFHLTGTTSVVTITTPVGCDATAVGACSFTVICDAVCAWTAAGNIASASGTVVAKTTVTFIWDASTSKWIPSSAT